MGQIRKAAIFGAAGAIGPHVAAELDRRGISFRAVGRSREKLERTFGKMSHAEIFDADLADFRSASAAARGVDTIIYTVGLPVMMQQRLPELMRTTLQAASAMGVERIVLVSSVWSYGVPRTSRVAESHPREPETRKGRYRKEQEDLVLAAGGAVIRLPDFYGPHAEISLATPIFDAALAGKTCNWIGPVNAAHEFVFVPDTGPVIVDVAECASCYGEAWNYGGPGAINSLDFITRVYRAAGQAPKYRVAGHTMLKVLGWFNPVLKEMSEMLYLLETPVILDDSKLVGKLGNLKKTSYDEGIARTLQGRRP
jgi:nucleoside-diphosphate-sugar epimerase